MKIFKKVVSRHLKPSSSARRKTRKAALLPVEISDEEKAILSYVHGNDLTMTSPERAWTTLMACKYVVNRNIPGDFVECGVWRGGNALIAASIFKLYGADKRTVLFDTFRGMTEPTADDRRLTDETHAMDEFLTRQRSSHNEWCYASLQDVTRNFEQAGLLGDGVVFVEGDVCATLADASNRPRSISVLRLDTDWYESTRMELETLYPLLSIGGVLIIDDYGHWAGSKQAADEYFARNNNRPFFHCIDRSGRAAVKVD
jgi:hypothetical protein